MKKGNKYGEDYAFSLRELFWEQRHPAPPMSLELVFKVFPKASERWRGSSEELEARRQAGSAEWSWNINMREMARIWKGGCIIRARFLDSIMRAYERDPKLRNLLLDDDFNSRVEQSQDAWRRAVASAQANGIAVPAMSGSLAYFDSYRSANLPQNLTQAQRDYFGSHTYQRNDKGADAPFVHTDWIRK